jgi:hypothetical protein
MVVATITFWRILAALSRCAITALVLLVIMVFGLLEHQKHHDHEGGEKVMRPVSDRLTGLMGQSRRAFVMVATTITITGRRWLPEVAAGPVTAG